MDEQSVDWPGLMRLGLGRLGLAPEVFWAMSPNEFRLALEGAGIIAAPGQAMTRTSLSALMAAFPDRDPAEE